MTRSLMKINLGVMACVCIAVTSAKAVPITLKVDPGFPPGTTPFVLGDVNPPEPASAADDVNYINGLIALSLGGSATVGGDTVYRSENSFGSLSTATTLGDKSGDTTSISLTTGFEYLVAKYGGPKGGLEIWDIAAIGAGSTIDIPDDAFGRRHDQYDLSGWWLFDGQSTREVPDGGSTALLLGFGLLGLGLMPRFLSREAKNAA